MKQQQPSALKIEEGQTFFGDLIDSLTERGRALLGRRSARAAIPQVDLAALGELLLSRRGEASGVVLAQTLLASYSAATAPERLLMVNYLYALDEIEKNHEAFAEKGAVVASAGVKKILRVDLPSRHLVPTR